MFHFKTKLKEYFGSDLLELSELCLIVAEAPKKRYEKIGKIFKANLEKLKKIIHSKDDELKKFKKRITLILSEHDTARQVIVSPGKMSLASVNDFKSSVQKSFSNFKHVVEEFSRHEKEIDESFRQVILQMTNLIQKQASHSLISHFLGKDK